MKTKDLISVTLKITGLIAFWKSMLALIVLIGGVGKASSLLTNHIAFNVHTPAIALSLLLNFLLPITVAFLSIFRTEEVMSFLKIDDQSVIDLHIGKRVFYRLIIIVFGIIIILNGAGNFIVYNYKTDSVSDYVAYEPTTNIEPAQPSTTETLNKQKTTVTTTKNLSFNFISLILMLIGVIMVVKVIPIANYLESKIETGSESKQPENL